MSVRKRKTALALAALATVLTVLNFWHVRPELRRQQRAGEGRNLAYIKVFKTASDGLAAMFRRFGLQRNLSFALPPAGRTYLGWPRPLSSRKYIVLQPGVRHPNLLVDHCIYNRTFLDQLMARPCAFVTSLRQPFRQIQSLFAYYRISEITGLSRRQDAFSAYMLNATNMEAAFRAKLLHACIPERKNSMSKVLGFREGVDDPQEFVDRIVSEFDLIIIQERFLESMILLKRLMNWSLKDILFEKQNAKPHPVLTRSTAPQVAAAHRNWSSVDYLLYDAAAIDFQRRVSEQDATFKEEVEEYRRVRGVVTRQCHRRGRGRKADKFTVSASRMTQQFTVSSEECRSFRELNREKLMQLSRQLQRSSADEKLDIPFC